MGAGHPKLALGSRAALVLLGAVGWGAAQVAAPAAQDASSARTAVLVEPETSSATSVARVQRWRGFNLTDMMIRHGGAKQRFREDDFRQISEWGFNFVRLPLSYKFWVDREDWKKVDEAALAPIDDAVAWGRKYGLHICINFHRAPGYTVAAPPEPVNLWTSPEALEACVAHWRVFARRYNDVPADVLSFNLINEPPTGLAEDEYRKIMSTLIAAIREISPERTIIVDGMDFGAHPLGKLDHNNVIQSARGYAPFALTHHQAPWVPDNIGGLPNWPPAVANGFLFGPWKNERFKPLLISGEFPEGRIILTVGKVSDFASLHVSIDGVLVLDEDFLAHKGGGVKPPVYREKYETYETEYDRELTVDVPAGAREIEIEVGNGDWLTLTALHFVEVGGRVATLPLKADWDGGQQALLLRNMAFENADKDGARWLEESVFAEWDKYAEAGNTVFVGEWGAYNKTPHDMTLRWMEDNLKLWKEKGWGWALWNFRGAFGVLDSGRSDVQYTPHNGSQLDGAMLELLRKY